MPEEFVSSRRLVPFGTWAPVVNAKTAQDFAYFDIIYQTECFYIWMMSPRRATLIELQKKCFGIEY